MVGDGHMKRIYAFLCVCLLLLTGCAPTAPTQEERAALSQMSTVIDGAFFCTPQELVDVINNAATNDESGLALQLSNYTAPGASIYLANGSSSVILTLEESDAGMLDDVRLYWSIGANDLNEQYSVGLYCGTIIGLLAPDHAEQVSDSFNEIFSTGYGSVEFDFDEIHVAYMAIDGKNWLDVEIAE